MKLEVKAWGTTTEIYRKDNVSIHVININKGGYCSKHYHNSKHNMFFVLNGYLKISVWKESDSNTMNNTGIDFVVGPHNEFIVPPREYHRFEALTEVQALEIYWSELEEQDIVREDIGGMRDEASTDLQNGDRENGIKQAVNYEEANTGIHRIPESFRTAVKRFSNSGQDC